MFESCHLYKGGNPGKRWIPDQVRHDGFGYFVARPHYSKKEVIIFDYVDAEASMLAKMYQRRLTG